MVEKSLIGRDFAVRQEGSVQLPRSNNQLEYGDSVDGTVFPSKFRGKPIHVVHGKGGCLVIARHMLYC